MKSKLLLGACLTFYLAMPCFAQEPIELSNAVVSLIDNLQVPAKNSGVVSKVLIKEGDLISEGQLVVQLDPTSLILEREVVVRELESARIAANNEVNIDYSRKSKEVAVKVLERSRNAVAKVERSISSAEIDRLTLEAERAELSEKQAVIELEAALAQQSLVETRLKLAEHNLALQSIKSPISGMIVQVYPSAGEWVTAGQPVARVIRLDRLRVKALVPAAQFDDSLTGANVELAVKLPPRGVTKTFAGKITFVSPEVRDSPQAVEIWAEVENPEGTLRPGTIGTLKVFVQ